MIRPLRLIWRSKGDRVRINEVPRPSIEGDLLRDCRLGNFSASSMGWDGAWNVLQEGFTKTLQMPLFYWWAARVSIPELRKSEGDADGRIRSVASPSSRMKRGSAELKWTPV